MAVGSLLYKVQTSFNVFFFFLVQLQLEETNLEFHLLATILNI